jgi:hypothetical protein
MSFLLQCLSHTPLKGYVDPLPDVVEEAGPVGDYMNVTEAYVVAADIDLAIAGGKPLEEKARGTSQDSCRLIHATKGPMSSA